MPPKSNQPSKKKADATEPSSSNATPAQLETHDALVTNWAKKLWGAIGKETTYAPGHVDFFKEFDQLREAAQAIKSPKVTMLNHVAPIYNHIASQGYQAHIHYLPLREAVLNFCHNKPVAIWIGPPDQFSRSSSPTLETPPKLGPPKKPTKPVNDVIVVSRKGKAKTPITQEHVRSDQDEESIKEPQPFRPTKPLPSTNGMEQYRTKCEMCTNRGHLCHVNPKVNTRPSIPAACFECNHWKLKCSLSALRNPPRNPRKKVEPEDGDSDGPADKPTKRTSRKKPAVIPIGQSGQYDAISLPPDMAKRLEDFESERSKQREKLEELSQAVARLTAENRSTREWFDTKLQLLWESTNKRDETMGTAFKTIWQLAEETSRHVALREAGRKLEAMFNGEVGPESFPPKTLTDIIPPLVSLPTTSTPLQTTSTPLPTTSTLLPTTSTPPSTTLTSPPFDLPAFPSDVPAIVDDPMFPIDEGTAKLNKRHSPDSEDRDSKRRKLGEL